MPIQYELRGRTLWLVTEGDVDYEDGLATLGAAIERAAAVDATPCWDVVFDIRRSREQRSADEMRGIAVFVGQHRDVLSGACAIIAADPLHFGLARMFEAYGELEGIAARVVDDEAAATAWLQSRAASIG